MTARAAWSGTSTKPKPRLLWVFLSSPIRALMTSPNGLTSLVSSAAVVVKGRFPIYNILLISCVFHAGSVPRLQWMRKLFSGQMLLTHSQFVASLDRRFQGEL